MENQKACKYCGNLYPKKALGGHTLFCKSNPARNEALDRLAAVRPYGTLLKTKGPVSCGFCGRSFPNTSSLGGHSKWCGVSQDKLSDTSDRLHAARKAPRKSFGNQYTKNPNYQITEETRNKLRDSMLGRKRTPEQREKASISAIKRCKEHPHTQFFGRPHRYRSEPCEYLKSKLQDAGLAYEEEYRPLADRFFRLDIAFPKVKLAIEVNGNQHYEGEGKLKPYYQNRHDLIQEAGWEILEVHFKAVYNDGFVAEMLSKIYGLLAQQDSARVS